MIPKAWGRLVTVIVYGDFQWLFFEAADGTIERASAIQAKGVLVERGKWVRK